MTGQQTVLSFGTHPILRICLTKLIKQGVKSIVLLPANTESYDALDSIAGALNDLDSQTHIETIKQDPLEYVQNNRQAILDASLVVTCNVLRQVEEAVGAITFDAPPRALIISRADEFHVKMRTAYKQHRVSDEPGDVVVYGIDLYPRPEPPTPEKISRVLNKLKLAVDLESDAVMQYMLLVASTSNVYKRKQGYPPAHKPGRVSLVGHEAEIRVEAARITSERGLDIRLDEGQLEICCQEGWSPLPLTDHVFGEMMAQEGLGLLNSVGRPFNGSTLDLMAMAALGLSVQI